MNYLLDTNICVHFLKGAFNLDVKIKSIGIENCFISEITLAELEFGVENSSSPYKQKQRHSFEKFSKTFEDRIIPIRPCFSYYALQKVKLRQSGMMISDFDLLIGCSGVVSEMIMVSENIKELNRIDNIQLENWVIRL